MENIKIKNYYNKMSEDTKIILVNILADNLIYLHDFEVVDKEFDCLRVDVAEYYENEEKLPIGVTKEDYIKLRELLDNIRY